MVQIGRRITSVSFPLTFALLQENRPSHGLALEEDQQSNSLLSGSETKGK